MIIKKYIRSLEAHSITKKKWTLLNFDTLKQWIPSLSEKAYEMVCCGFSFNLNVKRVNQQRSKTMIALTNRYFWLHFLIVLFNLGDLVKDITFTAAVQHFDTNIVQAYETETSTGDKVKYLIQSNVKFFHFFILDLKIPRVLGVQCQLCVHH